MLWAKVLQREMLLEARIEIVLLALVAGLTEGLEVTDIVGTATSKRNNVVDRQMTLYIRLSAAFALIMITLKDIFSDGCGELNARGFTHRVTALL